VDECFVPNSSGRFQAIRRGGWVRWVVLAFGVVTRASPLTTAFGRAVCLKFVLPDCPEILRLQFSSLLRFCFLGFVHDFDQ